MSFTACVWAVWCSVFGHNVVIKKDDACCMIMRYLISRNLWLIFVFYEKSTKGHHIQSDFAIERSTAVQKLLKVPNIRWWYKTQLTPACSCSTGLQKMEIYFPKMSQISEVHITYFLKCSLLISSDFFSFLIMILMFNSSLVNIST